MRSAHFRQQVIRTDIDAFNDYVRLVSAWRSLLMLNNMLFSKHFICKARIAPVPQSANANRKRTILWMNFSTTENQIHCDWVILRFLCTQACAVRARVCCNCISFYLKIVKRKRMHFRSRRPIPRHALNFVVNNNNNNNNCFAKCQNENRLWRWRWRPSTDYYVCPVLVEPINYDYLVWFRKRNYGLFSSV